MKLARPTRERKRPDLYLKLVRQQPLKPIRSDAEKQQAVRQAVRLSGRETPLDAGERDYLDTLYVLLDAYEAKTLPMSRQKLHGTPALKFLMAEAGLSVSDVGRIIGSQPATSEILTGRRELSKAHIRRLADHFKVSPALFL